MADNHSFDIVCEINHAEMHNAVVQAQHEIAVRYDFKGTRAVDRVQQEGRTPSPSWPTTRGSSTP